MYQGIVLGPCFWNIFFADVPVPPESTGGEEAMFADDLNIAQEFDRLVSISAVVSTLEVCRSVSMPREGRGEPVSRQMTGILS